MKIIDILQKKFTVSFEFFPPKNEIGEKNLEENLKELKKLEPDFVSVTYGAGGSTREKTKLIIEKIFKENNINTMAHLTCISHNKKDLSDILGYYKKIDVKNILALRGDIPLSMKKNFDIKKEEFPHTVDLIKMIKEIYGNHFSIGGAVFPEMHPESKNIDEEIYYLKQKIESGMEFGVTQLFYDNVYFYKYMEKLSESNIHIPILPGIMPITNYNQIKKFMEMCNAKMPKKLLDNLDKYKDNPDDVEKIGIEYCINQCKDLIKNGIKGLHFYTLNKSKATIEVFGNIK